MSPRWMIPAAAYLLGSIPFGFLIVRLRQGGDVRKSGSGNIGATNVLRAAGSVAGLLTLLLDAGKGYLAVWLAGRWSGGSIPWEMLAAVIAILGHMFPVWLRFRGGKGVATGLGVILPISPEAVLAAFVIWLVVVALWRFVSLGSVVAAAALPFLMNLFYARSHAPPWVVSCGAALIAILVIVRHRDNIMRIIAGTESRVTRRH